MEREESIEGRRPLGSKEKNPKLYLICSTIICPLTLFPLRLCSSARKFFSSLKGIFLFPLLNLILTFLY